MTYLFLSILCCILVLAIPISLWGTEPSIVIPWMVAFAIPIPLLLMLHDYSRRAEHLFSKIHDLKKQLQASETSRHLFSSLVNSFAGDKSVPPPGTTKQATVTDDELLAPFSPAPLHEP